MSQAKTLTAAELDQVLGYIEKQNFAFYSTIMNGVEKQKPRWKRIVEQTDGSLGELIGQIYIKDYLPVH